MKKRAQGRHIDIVFVLIVFSAFALSVLMVLAQGAGVYRNVSDITHDRENERTVLSYIRTKVRNLDNAGAVYIAPQDGKAALHITENIGSRVYKTVIYSHDGWLCELFSEASINLLPTDGMRITRIDDLRFEEQDGGAIKVMAGNLSLIVFPRSSNEIATGTGNGGSTDVTIEGGADG